VGGRQRINVNVDFLGYSRALWTILAGGNKVSGRQGELSLRHGERRRQRKKGEASRKKDERLEQRSSVTMTLRAAECNNVILEGQNEQS
jgi:hypothetical protein